MDEVARSIRVSSTFFDVISRLGYTFGGLVAAEGSFFVTRRLPAFVDGTPRLRFVFAVQMAARDHALLLGLQAYLRAGSIYLGRPGKPHHQPTATFSIGSHHGHRTATIPFAERFLLGSAKRDQFELWRGALDAYELERPNRWGKGPSVCSVAGCESPVRGRGLCRRHYYRETGY